ncbi:MAG: ribosylnicotinamide kinase [Trizodia sp. TS-e1964]|nr:MAG: ribosylnicotinamide kinase [Trizodia sp. TS-e1964]
MPPPLGITLGISGVSSSGKTSLAHRLALIFPHTLLLHQDDFYRPESESLFSLSLPPTLVANARRLPWRAGARDYDCAASIDLPRLQAALTALRARAPSEDVAPEGAAAGAELVSEQLVRRLAGEVAVWVRERPGVLGARGGLVLLEGFLLYAESVRSVREMLDVRLFLRAGLDEVRERRARRSGYPTIEGFWQDPEGYVDDVVWPNYVEGHAFLFVGGDVAGEGEERVLNGLRIRMAEMEGGVDETLVWAVEEVKRALEHIWEGEGV